MRRYMLKSKIHRATITEADLNYQGSLTIDRDLMDEADILPYEMVKVYNINNGARFETYAIEGERGKGDICLNGAAARMGHPGDLIIITTFVDLDESETAGHQPIVVHVDNRNRLTQPRKITSVK